MSDNNRTKQKEDDASGVLMMAIIVLIMAVVFVFASPGLFILSLLNIPFGDWIVRSWTGSQILVTALIISFFNYAILAAMDRESGSYRWRLITYAITAAWFPFSYYGLKIKYFWLFIGRIDWLYFTHYMFLILILIITLLIFGSGIFIVGLFSVLMGIPIDLAQSWSWVFIVQCASSLLISSFIEKSYEYNRFLGAWFLLNMIAVVLLCIFRFEFLWHLPNEILLHFLDKKWLARE